MATKNLKTGSFEPMDKLPSSTLKRHPKMELNKNDLLRLLSYLEGELQARDITIAALKAEKAKQLLYQAKYGRFGLGDPFNALQRDSDCQKDTSFDENAVKSMYDNQLAQLENLIATQRKAQLRMREQLAAVEKRYHKVCAELDEEKKKHALDTAQGDDVTYMLEKERERLKQEVEFEKGQVKRLEKELKKITANFEEESSSSGKHKQVALMLIKERKRLVERLVVAEHRSAAVEQTLAAEKSRLKGLVEGLAQDAQRSLQMEAAMEKHISEFDIEREQLKARLGREEKRNAELQGEVEHLRYQLETICQQYGVDNKMLDGPRMTQRTVTNIPVQVQSTPTKLNQPSTQVFKNTPPNTPPEVRRLQGMANHDSPERDKKLQKAGLGPNSSVKRAIMQFDTSPTGMSERTMADAAELATSRVNVIGPQGPLMSGPSSGSTVFTTPTGARISLNVGPTANNVRKSSPAVGRGVPPPVPPNKPAYVPPTTPGKASSPRPSAPSSIPPGKPQPPAKFGITIHKDKITIGPDSGLDGGRLINTGSSRQLTSGQSAGESGTVRKPSQDHQDSAVHAQQGAAAESLPSSDYSSASGPDLEGLQQLLVSMVEGPGEGGPLVIEEKVLSSSSSSSSSALSSQPTSSYIGKSPHLSDDTKDAYSPCTSPPPPPTVAPPAAKSEETSTLIHHVAFRGEIEKLMDLLTYNSSCLHETTADGSSALHWAAQAGREECVSLLLEHGANPNATRLDGCTALHVAAISGHHNCMAPLVQFGADINLADQSGATPLYIASSNGHLECCRALLDSHARIDTISAVQWTPLHAAVYAGHADCMELLLRYHPTSDNHSQSADAWNAEHDSVIRSIIQMTDSDSQTIVHLAAARDSTECLSILLRHCALDLSDLQAESVREVASEQCLDMLLNMDKGNERSCIINLELSQDVLATVPVGTSRPPETTFTIGCLKVTSELTWSALQHLINSTFMGHLNDVAVGLKTKKTSRYDSESADLVLPYSLGLSTDSIKHYAIGGHEWTPGKPNQKLTPFEVLCNNHCRQLQVRLKGWDDGCLDSLAYETLISLSMLQNYHRLIEQYRSVVFYGPTGTGKAHLAKKLAFCVQSRESHQGHQAVVHTVAFHPSFTRVDLVQILLEKGCLVPVGKVPTAGHTPILLLENLHKVSVADVFGDLLKAIQFRGPKNPVRLELTKNRNAQAYYMVESCFIIGTMHRSRSTGLELSIQQRFRWVHLRNDIEPIKNMLQRQLYRKLLHRYNGQFPPSDGATFRAVEWVICVWQRLNEGLGKLGLPELILGPAIFMNCPIEVNKPKAIYKWLSMLWNHSVAPSVSQAVIRGSGTDIASPGGQQKVANTALYVLMQRAVVSGCPLSGQEKERYLSSFHGSNELDIKMRGNDKREGRPPGSLNSPDGTQNNGIPASTDSISIDMGDSSPTSASGMQGSFIAVIGTKSESQGIAGPQSGVRPSAAPLTKPVALGPAYPNQPAAQRPSTLHTPHSNITVRDKPPSPLQKEVPQNPRSAMRMPNQAIAQKVAQRLIKSGKYPSRAMSPDPLLNHNRHMTNEANLRRAMSPDPYGSQHFSLPPDGTRLQSPTFTRGGVNVAGSRPQNTFSFPSDHQGNIIHVHSPPPHTDFVPAQIKNPPRSNTPKGSSAGTYSSQQDS